MPRRQRIRPRSSDDGSAHDSREYFSSRTLYQPCLAAAHGQGGLPRGVLCNVVPQIWPGLPTGTTAAMHSMKACVQMPRQVNTKEEEWSDGQGKLCGVTFAGAC
ncbi:hypothetical protein IG631_02223 [Alternaria alternata]|nr:hypothetical protein IG631_02223 [Alternaria alternata]